ncbi:Bidirectional sugar transporter SWEET3b [Zostera marina]|uniref:Bidirectional sugar transporter SWEET n=1 Tax=Zostera marina TaxID=29655 RepID=A0A0K9P948_ZOSMR|nr:Bidirectional sugar transporter SWEET3b [Zostera marina]
MNNVDYFCRKCIVSTSLYLTHVKKLTKFDLYMSMHGMKLIYLLFLFFSLTFKKVLQKKNIEGFSCIPYIMAMFNCLLYTWYGLPVKVNGCLLVPALLLFVGVALTSTFSFHNHRTRKILVGSFGLVASVLMYSSPLVAVKQVIKTRSVKFMPFHLSLFTFIATSLWMAYGLVTHDLVLAAPNMVGCPMGLLQLLVYFIYRNKTPEFEQPPLKVVDLEKNGSDITPAAPIIPA